MSGRIASPAGRRRGQPLVLLALVLGGWVTMRAALWDPAADPRQAGLAEPESGRAVTHAAPSRVQLPGARGGYRAGGEEFASVRTPAPPLPELREPLWPSAPAAARPRPLIARPPAAVVPRAAAHPAPPSRSGRSRSAGLAAGHNLLLVAGLTTVSLPPELAATLGIRSPGAPPPPSLAPRAPGAVLARAAARWSGDGWLLLRGGGAGGRGATAGLTRYGGSQAGATLRYRLAPESAHRPAAYVRVTGALAGPAEREAALGVAARPIAGLPVSLLAEARVQANGSGARVRPAAALVTELAPQRLPLGVEAELYAQAGYVGGSGATPFADAQLTATRAAGADGALRLGAGAWAGGQEGAFRVDLGPTAVLRLDLGGRSSRLALDWRMRVAGDAAPASGPALSLSAGF